MSKLLQIWRNKSAIIEGIANRIFRKEDVEAIHQFRIGICQGCEYRDESGKSCIVPGTAPCCMSCGCCLEIKTRSLSSYCPNGLWEAVLSQDEEDLFNESINHSA